VGGKVITAIILGGFNPITITFPPRVEEMKCGMVFAAFVYLLICPSGFAGIIYLEHAEQRKPVKFSITSRFWNFQDHE
jgi:hypothetical protein